MNQQAAANHALDPYDEPHDKVRSTLLCKVCHDCNRIGIAGYLVQPGMLYACIICPGR